MLRRRALGAPPASRPLACQRQRQHPCPLASAPRPPLRRQVYITCARNTRLRARFKLERQEARWLRRLPRSSSGSNCSPGSDASGAWSGVASKSGGEHRSELKHTVEAAARWLERAAGASSTALTLHIFAGVSVLLGSLVIAEAAALFGPPLCAAQ
jgi:hypothetical protein